MIQTIEISETHPLSQYVRNAAQDPTIITLGGRPIAAVVAFEDIDWESFSLSHNPKFLKIIERSRESQKKGMGYSSDEVREKLGLKNANE